MGTSWLWAHPFATVVFATDAVVFVNIACEAIGVVSSRGRWAGLSTGQEAAGPSDKEASFELVLGLA